MRAIERLSDLVGFLAASATALLVLLVVYDASMRYAFQAGSIALQELEWHLFDVVILLGIAYTLKSGAHVRVDILYEHFTPRTRALVDLVAALLFILPFSALIVYVGYDFVLLSFEQMECSSNPGGLPYRFLVKALMPLAFVVLALQALKEAADAWHAWRDA